MIDVTDLKQISLARLQDSRMLLKAKRWDGAFYLCGYALEVALKARICKTLGWPSFPETTNEFRDYQSFRTHKLDVLLTLSGYEKKIKTQYWTEWSIVADWNPELRYSRVGQKSLSEADSLIQATAILAKVFLRAL